MWIGLTFIATYCIAGAIFKANRYRAQRQIVELSRENLEERKASIADHLIKKLIADVEGRTHEIPDLERKYNIDNTLKAVDEGLLMSAHAIAYESACWTILYASIGFPLAFFLCFLFLKSLNPLEKERLPSAIMLWNFFVFFHLILLLIILVIVGVFCELIPPYVSDTAISSSIVLFGLCVLCLPILLLCSRRYAVSKGRAAPWGWLIILPVVGIPLLKRLRYKA